MGGIYKPRHGRVMTQFVDLVRDTGQTLYGIAPQAEVNHKTMSDWGRITEPLITDFDRAVQAAGGRLVIRKRETGS